MGKTIIQPIGPLYGEAVNGTVYGRPNGSIYVPPTNTITCVLSDEYICNSGSNVIVCNSLGQIKRPCIEIVAQSQDNAAYIQIEMATDSDFSTIVVYKSVLAGTFNITQNALFYSSTPYTVIDGTTYYVRTVLMAASGVPVAYSDVTEVTGIVVS